MNKEWEDHVRGFANSKLSKSELIANFALGLVCEAGEAGDVVKKHLFHGDPLNREKVILELGDVMFYWTALAQQLDIDTDEVLQKNIEKLRNRHKGKAFDSEVQRKSKLLEL